MPGATAGNRALLEAWRYHAGTSPAERLLAPPLILFRSKTIHRGGRAIVKGHVEFLGAALIERLEHVVQRDAAVVELDIPPCAFAASIGHDGQPCRRVENQM